MSAPRGFVHVLVHSAESLLASDFKLLKKPTSDPYCIVALGDQQHSTHTMYETTSPSWEYACSFQVGTFLPGPLLWLLGERSEADYKQIEDLPPLEFNVLDEDIMTADDALGNARLEMPQVLRRPEKWHQLQLSLQSPKGTTSDGCCGSLLVSLCWEPAPFLPAYASRMVASVCLATGFAMLLLAGSCRWQRPTAADLAPKQPGVAAAALLGSLVLLLATVLEFITAHMESNARIDDLAANQSCNRGLSDALSSFGLPRRRSPDEARRNAALLVSLRTVKLTQYEVSITPAVDLIKHLHLPIIVLTYLLPIGGMALSLVAMTLQLLQAWSMEIYAGQICNAFAFVSAAAGLAFAFAADALPRAKREEQKDKFKSFRRLSLARIEEQSSSGSPASRVRRRDVLRGKVSGLFGSKG